MEKTFSIAALKANSYKSNDAIIIPDWIFDCVSALCKLNIEYSGQLICYNKIVEYAFLSGNGSTGSVFPQKKMIVNTPGYTTIEFHTHPSALGDYWANKFSAGDMATFKNRVQQEGEGYQHILFTPTNVLTWGKITAPDIRIGFGNTDVVTKNHTKWNDKYHCWDPIPPQS